MAIGFAPEDRSIKELLEDIADALTRISFALEDQPQRDYMLIYTLMYGLKVNTMSSDIYDDAASDSSENSMEQLSFMGEKRQERLAKRERDAKEKASGKGGGTK